MLTTNPVLKSIGIVASARIAFHSDQIQWNITRLRIAVVAKNRHPHPSDFFRHRMLFYMTLNFFPDL